MKACFVLAAMILTAQPVIAKGRQGGQQSDSARATNLLALDETRPYRRHVERGGGDTRGVSAIDERDIREGPLAPAPDE